MKIKYVSMILIAAILFNFTAVCAFANDEGISWYIKRAGNKQPQLPREHSIIEKYNGFYLDKKLDDNSETKRIYLTFDAGYENGNIEKILNTLKEKNVPAAFFVLDHIINKNTDLVVRMANEGHLVCNHTKNHKNLSGESKEKITENVKGLEENYERITGLKMSKYFRFPEGRYSEKAISVINELGYKTIFWSFGYADWDDKNQPDAEKSKAKILENTHNGEVILLHPTSRTNAEILPSLIDEWRNMGYSFGTLDELVR
ncbi:MAG: delta-lactam-biosynthetic de-N-acetylase [Ruminococcaceae bacterium]|nr:delta-lactam-biosynthetic de-N-acetylase [Oscillospiraceae bacterium]